MIDVDELAIGLIMTEFLVISFIIAMTLCYAFIKSEMDDEENPDLDI